MFHRSRTARVKDWRRGREWHNEVQTIEEGGDVSEWDCSSGSRCARGEEKEGEDGSESADQLSPGEGIKLERSMRSVIESGLGGHGR